MTATLTTDQAKTRVINDDEYVVAFEGPFGSRIAGFPFARTNCTVADAYRSPLRPSLRFRIFNDRQQAWHFARCPNEAGAE